MGDILILTILTQYLSTMLNYEMSILFGWKVIKNVIK